jgi:hypothetical protein
LRERLVIRRGAAGGCGDVHVFELEAIVAVGGGRLIGESGFVEDGVHEFSGGVAGERAAGAVGAVGSGCEAEDDDPGLRVSEAGDGLAPVVVVFVSAPFIASDGFTVDDQSGAAGAGDDFGVEAG